MRTLALLVPLTLCAASTLVHAKAPLFRNVKVPWGQTIEEFKAKNPKAFDPVEVGAGIKLTFAEETFSGRPVKVSHVFIDGKLAIVKHELRYPLGAPKLTIADDFAQAKKELGARWGKPDKDEASFARVEDQKRPAGERNQLVMNGALKLLTNWKKGNTGASLEASRAGVMAPGLLKVIYLGSSSPNVTVEDIARRALR